MHLFRKFYLNSMSLEQETAWKGGALLFLLTQFVIFSGLTLCCTHLSDITLTIATNAFHSFCLFIGKLYWLLFTDQTLNVDTLTRLAYLHYISAFMLAYFGAYHGVDMHYDWKTDEAFEGIKQELNWYDEALLNEVGQFIDLVIIIGLLCVLLYPEPDALNYEIFMWGDVGMQTDVRFFGVAPHWYFRPYMAWLIACPFHYLGLIGLALFFVSFYFQPNILAQSEFKEYTGIKAVFMSIYFYVEDLTVRILNLSRIHTSKDLFYQITYGIMLISLLYAFSYLPYGRFFNRLGGNGSSLLAFAYIYIYMSTTCLRSPKLYNLSKVYSN
jgi:quinol-cytochrome oxidoreductase complex cytochrome b subunit